MDLASEELHILFFPLLTPGHMIPMVDMAKLFAARGVRATVLTTPANAAAVHSTINRADDSLRHRITVALLHFPSSAAVDCENMSCLPTQVARQNFLGCLASLCQPFDQVLREIRPDCIVADMFYPWTLGLAKELGIPLLFFHGMSLLALSVSHSMNRPKPPLESLPDDPETVVILGLPRRIELKRSQIPDLSKISSFLGDFFRQLGEAEMGCSGVLVNSFYELEPDFADHYKKVAGRKTWPVGPVSLCNKDFDEKSSRGDTACLDSANCLSWLDCKPPSSVLYVCFGSLFQFSPAQLREMALGFEASNTPFIWVVRNKSSEWLPEGYEQRVLGGGKGMIIRGWAPQILILNHPAVGGFLTHCGWNSCLEAATSGLPMVTWPLFADQFVNERLIVDVLKVGIGVGATEYVVEEEKVSVVKGDVIARVVSRVMGGGEEAEGMRKRARELGVMARKAVEVGGSSYVAMGELIKELNEAKAAREES
ncbi:scopoletin glucosyltransferase-like [Phoenix dactylifera]|uniref:Glycosyltransferase n=1 Tax=Phoenix dactylifera TaxID=42345 RepID=A0A8B7CJW4_PHODC|nr:scopoletin glucosyltransferase-like [Phoenix dactylifera]